MSETLAAILDKGIKLLGFNISKKARQIMLDYVLLLHKWNKTYNLTASKSLEQIVVRHVLDSLAITNFVEGNRILDVGAGAGFPGIPLALVSPEKQFYLLDSNNKKCKFLFYAKTFLNLKNINIIHDRVESFQPKEHFTTIITRAFASMAEIIAATKHLMGNNILLAMKGKKVLQELSGIQEKFIVHEITVPFLPEQRFVVQVI